MPALTTSSIFWSMSVAFTSVLADMFFVSTPGREREGKGATRRAVDLYERIRFWELPKQRTKSTKREKEAGGGVRKVGKVGRVDKDW